MRADALTDNGTLASFSEYDLDFEGMAVHCFEAGTGAWSIILLHGSGAGASTLSNFRRVMGPLADWAHVLAADLIGFGRSGLKKERPYFDMDLWVRQLRFLLDHVGSRAICVGHSLSGAIALKAAASDSRIHAVVTTGTMGWIPTTMRANPDAAPRWNLPRDRASLRENVERTFYDPRHVDEEELDRREAVLDRPGYTTYFQEMFAGPSIRYFLDSSLSTEELGRIECPVALMHGRVDKWCGPEETSIPLGNELRAADIHIFSECAHSVAHERPADFLAIVRTLADRLETSRLTSSALDTNRK